MAGNSGFSVNVSEIRRPSAQYKLDVKWWTTVRDLKEYLSTRTGEHINGHHLYFESGTELNGDSTLHDLGINKSGVSFSLLLDTQIANQSLSETGFISPFNTSHLDDHTNELVRLVKAGFDAEKVPTKPSDDEGGTAGVYFMKGDDDHRVAVFKPHDEEQGMPNNPKNRTGDGAYGAAMREHFKPGYGCIREWATYVMDVGNFAGVPPTLLVNCEHRVFSGLGQGLVDPATAWAPKFGSLQKFIPECEGSDEYSWSLYSDLTVQKSALLDLRTLNCDRNSENLLVKGGPSSGERLGVAELKERLSLVPIDHGYALPSVLRICQMDWTWMTHPQVRVPLCPEIKAYLAGLSFDEVAAVIRPHLPEECIYLLQAAHWLVTMAAGVDLSLYDMANLVARDDLDPDKPSRLEEALYTATENTYRAMEIKGARRPLGKGWGAQGATRGAGTKAGGGASSADGAVGAVPAPEVVQERMQRSRRGSNSPLDAYGQGGDTRLRRHNSTAVGSSMPTADWRSLGFSPTLRSSPTVVGTPVLQRTKSALPRASSGAGNVGGSSGSCDSSDGTTSDDGSSTGAAATPTTRMVVGGGGLTRMAAIGGLGNDGAPTPRSTVGSENWSGHGSNGCIDANSSFTPSSLTYGHLAGSTSLESQGEEGLVDIKCGKGVDGHEHPRDGSAAAGLVLSPVGSPRVRLGAPTSPTEGGGGGGGGGGLYEGSAPALAPAMVTSAWAARTSSASAPTSPMMAQTQAQTASPRPQDGAERNNKPEVSATAGNGLERFVVLQRQVSLPDRLQACAVSPHSRQSKVITRIPSAESFFSEPVREGDDEDGGEDVDEDEDQDQDQDQEEEEENGNAQEAWGGEGKGQSKGEHSERSPREVKFFADGPLDSTASDLTWKSGSVEDAPLLEVYSKPSTMDENGSVRTDATTVETASVEQSGSAPLAHLGSPLDLDSLPIKPKVSVASPRLAPVKLSRVVSFNGFDAAPLDDLLGNGKNSRMERRRELSLTEDFKKLRLRNTEEAIRLLVIKAARRVLREGRRSI